MVKVEVLDELFGVREGLELRIIQLHPTSGEQTAQVSRLMTRRDHVTSVINAIIAAAFISIASPELLQAVQGLKDKAAALNALANAFDRIDEVLSVVDEVLGVVVRIVELAA
jgi:hypothetical protein